MLLGLLLFGTFFELPTLVLFGVMSLFCRNTTFKLFWSSYIVVGYYALFCLAPNPLIGLGAAMIVMVAYPILWIFGCALWCDHGPAAMFVRDLKRLR